MLDPLVYLAAGTAVAIPAVWHSILRNLPENPVLTPVDERDLPFPLRDRVDEYRELGFERMGPAYRIALQPPAVLVPLRAGDVGATVFLLKAPLQTKLGYDVVSRLEGGAWLTTAMDHSAGVLPAPRGVFRQILPRAPVATLHDAHLGALDFLQAQGLAPAPLPEFEPSFREALRLQRARFREAPLRHTLLAIWRSVSQRNAHVGPLAQQAGIEAQVREALDAAPALAVR